MTDLRALISCNLVWDAEAEVVGRLAAAGISVDMPRFAGQQLEEEDLLPIVGEYDGILAGDDHLTRRVLESAPRLRTISKWGIGVDGIDLEAADDLGIRVFNTPGVFGEELADYAMGYIHMLARRQHQVDRMVRAGEWHKVRGTSLAGLTLGIVGLGSSGQALVGRASAASMTVLGYDIVEVSLEGCDVVPLDELLRQSDIVSLQLPATAENRHMINEEALALMKDDAWLVNISRGDLVDEKALIEALKQGTIGAAALDVFEVEPLPADSPLAGFENVILGSHNGSNTSAAVARTTRLAVENLASGLGVPLT